MRSNVVCFSLLVLAVGPTSASPLSAQRIDTRFSETEADPWNEGPEAYLAAATFGAVGSVPGSSLGAWIAGRDAGVGFGGAPAGAFPGLGSGIALEAATGGESFPAAFVVGRGVRTALVAGAFADGCAARSRSV